MNIVPLCGETKDGSVKPAYKINTKTTKYAADLTYRNHKCFKSARLCQSHSLAAYALPFRPSEMTPAVNAVEEAPKAEVEEVPAAE